MEKAAAEAAIASRAIYPRRLLAGHQNRRAGSTTNTPKPNRFSIITATCPPRDIAENRQFKNLFEIWLEGDHYKWRAMRANGVAERFCTGDAEPFDKFRAWAATVPHTLRNPLYHWTHLELKRYFGIDELLNEQSAAASGSRPTQQLATPEFTTQGILKKFNVKTLCTTDDPADDLKHHRTFAAARPSHADVARRSGPDKALAVDQPGRFQRLGRAAGRRPPTCDIDDLQRLPRRLAQAPRLFPRAGLPAVRPRPQPVFRRRLAPTDRRRDFRQGAPRPGGHRRRSTPNSRRS